MAPGTGQHELDQEISGWTFARGVCRGVSKVTKMCVNVRVAEAIFSIQRPPVIQLGGRERGRMQCWYADLVGVLAALLAAPRRLTDGRA